MRDELALLLPAECSWHPAEDDGRTRALYVLPGFAWVGHRTFLAKGAVSGADVSVAESPSLLRRMRAPEGRSLPVVRGAGAAHRPHGGRSLAVPGPRIESGAGFDPTTGNVVARFDTALGDWSQKGLKTVEILLLDRREALAAGYRKTFSRLSAPVERYLAGETAADTLAISLKGADDHGLLIWCFLGAGRNESPFRQFRERDPKVWTACVESVQQA